MSGVLRLASVADVPGVRLVATTPSPGRSDRSGWRRRAALGLALAVLVVLAVLVAAGKIDLPGAGSATAAPGPQVTPPIAAVAADPSDAEAQPGAAPVAPEGRPASDRVVAPAHAGSLFARHSWYVRPPPPKPPPPPPPPQPTAPPFPYTFVGSYTPAGDPPVYFLSRGDRVVDAHVGDKLDGVYQFESATGGQLVFVYLPLNIRQNLAAKVSH